MQDPYYAAIFKLNSIANYDPAILSILDAPYGSAFYKDEAGNFILDEDDEDEPDTAERH